MDGELARHEAFTQTDDNRNRMNIADIHASSGIRIHDPSIRVDKNASCLRPRGHSDRQISGIPSAYNKRQKFTNSTLTI
jgi:hypothetical protein